MEDQDQNYCKLCLVTDVKMFSMNIPSILEAYSQLVQVVVFEGYQMYACYECVRLLHKYKQFRLKCMTALNVLSSIHMDHSKITKEVVQNIDRNQFNLKSKLECSSIILCNSNDQMLLPSGSNTIKNDIDLDEIIKSDTPEIKLKIIEPDIPKINIKKIESDVSEIKLKMDACDTYDIQDVITLSDDSNENQDRNKNVSNEIFLLSNHYEPDIASNDYVPEINMKRKRIQKLKKRKENAVEPVAKRSRQTKGKEKKLSRREKWDEDCINYFKDYATVVLLSPEDARNEMLLRKDSTNYMMNPYKCDLCYKGFERQLTYDNHMKKHSPENGSWECEYCHIRFSEKKFMYRHTGQFHKKKYICMNCPHVTCCWKQATAHMNRHKGKKYECRQCGLTFRMPNTLSNHKRVKHPTAAVCALCGSTFAALRGLTAHRRLAHRQDNNIELVGPKCAECDVQFATETAWKRHLVLSSKHTVLNGCEECGEVFPSREDLQLHSRRHSNHERYHFKAPAACKICNKWLTSKSEYKIHMSSQHPSRYDTTKIMIQKQEKPNEKQFICETCGMVFKQYSLFQDHGYKHTNERPYKCRECGKGFNYRTALYIHKRIHNTPDPVFQCDICQKQYYTKNTLTKHIKAHLGIRPYQCSFCQKYFPHKCEVRTHINYVHRKQPWPKRDRTKRKAQ